VPEPDEEPNAEDKVIVEPQELPVLPRTSTSTIATAAPEPTPPAAEPATAPVEPEAAAAPARGKRATIDPATLRETNNPADLISLPRTMSEEWMARDADDGAYEEGPRRPRWIVPVAGGVAAIAVVAVVFAMGGSSDSPAPRKAAGPGVEVVAIVSIDAAAPALVVPPVVPIDAPPVAVAPAVVPVDAAAVAVAPIDAGTAVVVAPVDAAVAVAAVEPVAPKPVAPAPPKKPTVPKEPTAPKVPTAPKEPKPKVPTPPKDERTIEQLVAAGELAKANTACTTNTQFSTPRLVACATAACNQHSLALATRWIRAIPRASRDEVIGMCKALGVDVVLP
jgi:hypothetical protein